jgi:AcrR family transcriptional regulator
MTAVRPARTDTRTALVRAGERLFATRGIDGVSLREITRAAGQANVSALQYHFGDRTGLLRAIISKHRSDTEPRRHALLDQYETAGIADHRALASALVLPLVAKLSDPDGGRQYLQINCDLYTRPQSMIEELVPWSDPTNSMRRWHRLLDPLVPSEERSILHSRFPAIRFAFVELAHRAMAPPRRDDQLFASHVTDLVTALLTAPPSEETVRLIQQRRTSRSRRES